MDITTLAAWGEFIGGIAVVASLIYLAGQIRMNTKTVRAANFGDLLTVHSEFVSITTDPEVASLYLRGLGNLCTGGRGGAVAVSREGVGVEGSRPARVWRLQVSP
jgi:hypothetical protein